MTEPSLNEQEPKTSLRRPSPAPWIFLALVVVAVAIYFGFRRTGSPVTEPPPSSAASTPAAAGTAAAPATNPTSPLALKELLAKVSSDPLVRIGLGLDDLIRRTAIVIDNLAQGTSPRRALAFLAPKGSFETSTSGARTIITPSSYARFDGFGGAVGSVDAAALAAAYQAAHPELEAAYRALGYPAGGIDRALASALRRIAQAPVRDGEVELVAENRTFTFAEASLERLSWVDKQFLRMGPRNTRIIEAKAKELLTALSLPSR